MNHKFQRHIIINEIDKKVYFQVMPNFMGKPIVREYQDIKAGRWHDLAPEKFRQPIADLLNNGFTIVPFWIQGVQNKDLYIMQIIGMNDRNDISISHLTLN